MSWLFSQALVEAYSEDISLDGERSAPLSGNHTQLAYLQPDKMTAFSRLSRFGMTFRPLTVDRGEALLTSYLAAFHARTFQSQDEGQDSTESGQGCGEKWRGWLAKYDPNTSTLRTAQCSLLEEEPESLQTLPRSGMTRDGLLWEQPMWERHTNETGSGWWPTPTTPSGNCVGRLDEWGGSRSRSVMKTLVTPEELRGQLNPTWVEWLMGWPPGWTDLKPLEMDKFQQWQQQHGRC